MQERKYAEEKPKECRLCYFWRGKKRGCSLGEENCYYLIQTPDKPKSECDGCPYGKNQPCIGWCTKKILQKSGGAASEGE